MRVNFLLVAVAALVGIIDASVAATNDTVAKLGMANPAFAAKSYSHRSLRLRKDDVTDNEENPSDDDNVQENRMWSFNALSKAKQALEDKLALTAVASNFVGKSTDDMGEVIKSLTPEQINTIFDTSEDSIKKILPGFHAGMDASKFDDLIRRLPQDQQVLMLSAYSKYLHNNGML